MKNTANILDLIDKSRLQRFQDAFAKKNRVATVMMDVNGTPITEPSRYCLLCRLIRSTEKGLQDCKQHGKNIAQQVLSTGKYAIKTCVRNGFADSSAPLIIRGEHLASWAMGQANIQDGATERDICNYAKKIGLNPDELAEAFKERQHETETMTQEQFRTIIEALLRYSKQIMTSAEVSFRAIMRQLA
ncbi:MAG: PocR ligand-binding domain-containing protein [Desulfococcaceae bacterium]